MRPSKAAPSTRQTLMPPPPRNPKRMDAPPTPSSRFASGQPPPPTPNPSKKRRTMGVAAPPAPPMSVGDTNGNGRRALQPPPAPPPRRRPEPPPVVDDPAMPPTGSVLLGSINTYDPQKGYGFIYCDMLSQDVYFNRAILPPEAQKCRLQEMRGVEVEFHLLVTPDGKPRTEQLTLLGTPNPPADRGNAHERRGREDRDRDREKDRSLPPISEEQIQQMTEFLEEKGGVMDYGKFSSNFPGIKKAQLEGIFVLGCETPDNQSGRWQIALEGVDMLTPEERAEREAAEREAQRPERDEDELLPEDEDGLAADSRSKGPFIIEPGPTFRLIGCVTKWDYKKGYGFLTADGAQDVFVHKNDLPESMHGYRGKLEGCEVTFEIEERDNGKLKAVNVHMLLSKLPSGEWTLRRV
eukprot:TRINITY_DN64333_c0_g1_i1.p1 TRINITY_DN64333_c0_g1~~TRINITY_DN64333_c0_g1_i1.p1  ORF type:complete len:435 (+),score=90.18 TRINITY_DN64333_c0_g1_i1:80-1306(+)